VSDFYQPIDVAVALSLYFRWESPSDIAAAICDHFDDDKTMLTRKLCLGVEGIVRLPPQAGKICVELAMEAYGREAINRNTINGVRD